MILVEVQQAGGTIEVITRRIKSPIVDLAGEFVLYFWLGFISFVDLCCLYFTDPSN